LPAHHLAICLSISMWVGIGGGRRGMLTLLIGLGTLIWIVTRVKLVDVLLRAGAVLGSSSRLSSHLKLADLSL
jgi:hypothetical protein